MNSNRRRRSVSDSVGLGRRRQRRRRARLGAAVALVWIGSSPLAAGAAPSQDLDDPDALVAFLGMPEDLADAPGRIVHARVSSTPSLVTFRLGVVRDGRDLDIELSSLTRELSDQGWALSAPQEYMGAFEIDGSRGEDEVLLASVEMQPDGSVVAFYSVETPQGAPDATPPGALLQDIHQLRADDSLTFTDVQLTVTSSPLQRTGIPLGPRTIDAGSSLLVSMEAPAERADAVNAAIVSLCDQPGFECPDRLGVADGRVYGTIRVPGGSEGTISTTVMQNAGVIGVSFRSFDDSTLELPAVSLPDVSSPDASLPDLGGAGSDEAESLSPTGRGEAQGVDDDANAPESGGAGGLGLGVIAAVAAGIFVLVVLVVGARRRRRTDTKERNPPPDDFALANIPHPVGRVDAAVRRIATLGAKAGQRVEVQAARVGDGAVEVLLGQPIELSDPSFESADGRVWTVNDGNTPGALDGDVVGFGPAAHALVRAGDLAGDPVVIDIAKGVTLLRGDSADVDDLMQAWAVELGEGRWSTRPAVVALGAPINRADVVKVDEGSLRSFAARRAGQVVVVFADDDRAIESGTDGTVGVVCRRLVVGSATRTLSITDGRIRVEPVGLDLDRPRPAEEAPQPAAAPEAVADEPPGAIDPAAPAGPAPPRVLVRVLGSVTIDGAEKVAMRRSKVKECIAYLAFHRDGVTGDQLMSALWPDGSANRGMLNQTLSRARHAMGNGSDGTPIIRYVSAGRYGAGPDLVTDLEMLEEALATGSSTSGLIVGGTPFSAGEGYEWAYREGHAARANVLIERAAEAEGTKSS